MKFNFRPLTVSPDRLNVQSGKLGATFAENFTINADKGKPMKKGNQGNFVICSDGDTIEGFVDSVNPETVDKFSFGGVACGVTGVRFKAICETNGAAVLTYVVAGTNAAAGTANATTAAGLPIVKSSASSGTTVTPWRIVATEANGTATTGANQVVYIERM